LITGASDEALPGAGRSPFEFPQIAHQAEARLCLINFHATVSGGICRTGRLVLVQSLMAKDSARVSVYLP
jgi:hypothetical protein